MPANSRTFHTSDNSTPDWIELYNAGSDTLNTAEYQIADSKSRWQLPASLLPPGAYCLIMASGRDMVLNDEWHSNFKLSADGEMVRLYHLHSELIDSIAFPALAPDVSYGRSPNGGTTLAVLFRPTIAAPNDSRQRPEISVSHESGVFGTAFEVAIHCDQDDAAVRYTTDGSMPDDNSLLVSGPLSIDKTMVLRVRACRPDGAESDCVLRSFIVNEQPRLPVLSVSTCPENLWSDSCGIYCNWEEHGVEWERPARVELIEGGSTQFAVTAGIRIHGNISRDKEKKGFRLYFREGYGQPDLDYELFPVQRPGEKNFKRLVLYPPAGDDPSGSKWFTHISDVMTHSLWAEQGGFTSAYKPVALYLNGSYWGIYWIRENICADYAESRLGYDKDDLDLIRTSPYHQGHDVKEGDDAFWLETLDFFNQRYFPADVVYEQAISSYFDRDNFIDYYIFNIFGGNDDWPQNNVDMVRQRSGDDTRWRFVMWDAGAAWHENTPDVRLLEWNFRINLRPDIRDDWGSLLWSTVYFRQFMNNAAFKTRFYRRFCDLMNTVLLPDSLEQRVDRLAAMVAAEMPREEARWGESAGSWRAGVKRIKDFVKKRRWYQLLEIGDIEIWHDLSKLTVEPVPGQGRIKVNTLPAFKNSWSGDYFNDLSVQLIAIPEPGYHFSHWTDGTLPQQDTLVLNLQGDRRFEAVFEADSLYGNVLINEIMYFPGDNMLSGDWVELHNRSDREMDVSGWQLSDVSSGETCTLPAGSRMPPRGYAVICRDSAAFMNVYSPVSPPLAVMPFGLAREGDGLLLFNACHVLMDSVIYDGSEAWPIEANGYGATLELIADSLDNSLPTSWQASDRGGTPGATNSQGWNTAVRQVEDQPLGFDLLPAYPNPFNPVTTVGFMLPCQSLVELTVYDMTGRRIMTVCRETLPAGHHERQWKAVSNLGEPMPSGVYILELRAGSSRAVQKIVLSR